MSIDYLTEVGRTFQATARPQAEPLKRSHKLLLISIALGFAIVCTLIGIMCWELDQIRRSL